jgi:cytochrome c55X
MSRWLLASVLSLLCPAAAGADALPSDRLAQLHDLLVQDCGSCHGLTMHGGLGPALLPATLRDKPRELLIDTVMNGRPDTAMPPWAPLLSRDEAAWMIDQLRQGLTSP